MNHFPDCHREKRSDVAIQLIDCSRGLPQSPRLLCNDKQGEFICRIGSERGSYRDCGNETPGCHGEALAPWPSSWITRLAEPGS
jgi:hypothetical protein